NNYRDRDDDAAGGKRTLAVRFGLQAMRWLYLCNGVAGIALSLPLWLRLSSCILILPAIALVAMLFVWRALSSRQGAALNPVLAKTAMLMFLFSLTYLLSTLFLC
ncbi:MAG: UbiA family prenyltransferase, partial [Duncaniella sp.]|nr:UbiA family prenyltransferase [Duncaniella sp.]